MLKIVSDPTVYPIREVDLSRVAGGLTLTPKANVASRDMTFERGDGGKNVAYRKRRLQGDLEASVLESEHLEQIEELIGFSSYGATRALVYLFPPFDVHTRLSAPMQGSLKAWEWQEATSTLALADPTYSRASVAFSQDQGGVLQQAASGEERYLAGALGRGVLLERALTNLMAVAHPSSGTLGWSAGVGSPTLEWVTGERSPYRAAGGCLRVRTAAGSTPTITATGTCGGTAGTRLLYVLGVRSNCSLRVTITIGAQSQNFDFAATSANTWRELKCSILRTTTDTSFTITLQMNDDGSDRVVFVGQHHAEEVAGTYTLRQSTWSNVARAADSLSYAASAVPGATTITLATKLPTAGQAVRLATLTGGAEDISIEWTDFARLRLNYSASEYVEFSALGTLAQYAGRKAVITARIWPTKASIRFAIASTTHGPIVETNEQTTDPAVIGDYAAASSLVIGEQTARAPGDLTVGWVRLDARAWDDEDVTIWERMILETGFRDVLRACSGRKCLLEDFTPELIPGTEYHRATMPFEEVSRVDEMVVSG